MSKLLTFLTASISLAAASASACPECYYDFHGACLPNSGCTLKAVAAPVTEAVPNAQKIGAAIIHGDSQALAQAIGHTIIQNNPTVNLTAGAIIPADAQPFVDSVIGRGFLIFLGSGNPTFVFVDQATGSATSQQLTPAAPLPPAPETVEPKIYVATAADCLTLSHDGVAAAQWVRAPELTDSRTNQTAKYPDVELRSGDSIEIKSSNAGCAIPNKSVPQTYVSEARITYGQDQGRSGTSGSLKFFIWGAVTK
jgi:hypothetical protein